MKIPVLQKTAEKPEKPKKAREKQPIPAARLISLLLLILTVAGALYVVVETEPDYTRYGPAIPFEGRGTKTDPYLISSVEDAAALSDLVNKGNKFENTFFRQTKDLDFSSVENWTPIGNLSTGFYAYFYGVYDGAGHTINNIRCDNRYAGYFGLLAGEVRNLGIESGSFTGETIGSITSHGKSTAVIFNCYNKADVDGIYRAGGIADNFGGEILFCWNLGEVTSNTRAASLVSYNAKLLYASYTTDSNPMTTPNFQGEVKDSKQLTEKNLQSASFWNRLYEERREYDPMLLQDSSAIYMVAEDEEIFFADAGFVPEIFQEEYSRLAFLASLPEFLLIAAAVLLLVLLPSMVKKIQTANAAAAEAARIAREKAAQKAEEKAAAAPQETEKEPETSTPRAGWLKQLACACAFVLLFIWMFSEVNDLLLPKRHDGIINVQQYETLAPGSVDVLIIGGSSAAVNLDFATFWDEYGISVFGLGSGVQPIWSSYYQLQEGIETNKPKVVILDVKGVTFHYEYSDAGVKTTSLLGLPYSLNRIEAVRAAAQSGEQLEYILGFPQYHSRFSSLTEADFALEYGPFDWGTWSICSSVGNVALSDVSTITEEGEIPYKSEFYLRQIIECCQENNVELVLIKTPDTQILSTQPLYNAVQSIADEYDVPFINYNLLYDEVGFLPTDFGNDNYHLSVYGARKHSRHLCEYLLENYSLEDHRGDEAYSAWDAYVSQRQNAFLSITPNRNIYLKELGMGDYDVFFIEHKQPTRNEPYQEVVKRLKEVGIDLESRYVTGKTFRWNGNYYTITRDNTATKVYLNEDGREVYVGGMTSQGILCIVCDNETGEIADISALIQANGFAPTHTKAN